MGEFIKKYKLYIILGISTLILLIGTTIAWYVWESTNNDEINLEVCTPTITFVGGSTINGTDMIPVSDKENGIKKEIEVAINNNCNTNVTMYLDLELTTLPTALADETFVYELYRGSTQVKTGNFENKVQGNTISLLSETTITDGDTFTLYIYIDGTKDNSSEMANKSFTFNLFGYGKGAIFKRTLVQTITNLYINATKSTVTNNGITYNYATSVSLMNDRLGSSTTDINGGNIRYYGANPNNYVYFNCSDYSNQSDTTCEKWRIIGVFDGKVKIIRNESIGDLAWDMDKNIDSSLTTYDNNWNTSSLKVLLNEKYYNGNTSGTVTYYSAYSGSNDGISTSLNMSNKGIKNNITRNMISEETYYLRGDDSTSKYSNEVYDYERNGAIYSNNEPTWQGKVAIAYPSDYAYAVNFNQCTENLINYNDSSCAGNNWLKDVLGTSNTGSDGGWLLTPFPIESGYAWRVSTNGTVHSRNTVIYARKVVPTLYLDTGVKLANNIGNGTSTNPYRLSV